MLSPRQTETLRHLAEGLTDAQGAAEMGIKVTTFRRHAENARWRLDAVNRVNAVAQAIRLGIID